MPPVDYKNIARNSYLSWLIEIGNSKSNRLSPETGTSGKPQRVKPPPSQPHAQPLSSKLPLPHILRGGIRSQVGAQHTTSRYSRSAYWLRRNICGS